MVKAGSIAYALMICIVVGIFCYALLLMSSYAKLHQTMLFTLTELVTTNESAQNYFLGTIEEIKQQETNTDILDNGIITKAEVRPWGFYEVLITASIFKRDTIQKVALIGQHQKQSNMALYLTDIGRPLYMVEKAKIIGNAFLPKTGIKTGYITSNSFNNGRFLVGSKSASKTQLPRTKKIEETYLSDQIQRINAEEIEDGILRYNKFTNATLVIENDGKNIRNKHLSGNIVLKARDSIFIGKDNVLKDILIEAPKVTFEKGFVGTVQVIATERVVLEEGAILKYPSGILMNNGKVSKREITLKEKSKILGGIVIDDTNKSLDKLVTIDKGAELIGDLYCSGEVQLKGTVIGTVYTSSFYLKTKSSSYSNYIMNGVLDKKSLPDNFIGIPLFNSTSEQFGSYGIIKSI